MRISLNWLKDFVEISSKTGADEIASALTDHTVEVEGFVRQAERFEKIVVGKVLEVKKHPNADRLHLTVIDIKKEKLDIVCGAPNIAEGQLVPVALIGAVLPGGLEIKESTIRGEKSFGMVCAEDELGIGTSHEGIIVLDPNKAKIGQDFASYLGKGDTVFEVDNKSLSNRSDLLSHYGLARELSAILEVPLKPYEKYLSSTLEFPLEKQGRLDVKIEDKDACLRYMAVRVDGVKVSDSPDWLKERLVAVDQHPVNNIVDLTNYVMLDCGQPLHAFDASAAPKIVVRKAKPEESIETLDGKERALCPDDLIITDGKKPLAVAGIMGGQASGIKAGTSSIIIEAANFSAAGIRKTSQRLGLRTDASTRFEKSLDPALTETAMKRMLSLLLEICPEAKIASQLADIDNSDKTIKEISLDLSWMEKKIGAEIPPKKTVSILERLGFGVVKDGNARLSVTVPSWRSVKDVVAKEDLVEEVLRIYGYDRIPSKLPVEALTVPESNGERFLERRLKSFLAAKAGAFEVYNYSFVGSEQLKKLGIDFLKHLKLANPLSENQNILRQSLVPNLALNIKNNQAKADSLDFFEFGSVFFNAPGNLKRDRDGLETLPYQEKHLALAAANGAGDVFSSVKGEVEILIKEIFGYASGIEFSPVEDRPGWADSVRCARVVFRGQELGVVAELSRSAASNMGIKKKTAFAEINFTNLFRLSSSASRSYEEPDKYPAVIRDLAFVLHDRILYNEVKKEIESADSLIRKVELFDAYSGNKLEAGEKSLAFHISFQSSERTLTAEEVDTVVASLIRRLEDRFEARLRD